MNEKTKKIVRIIAEVVAAAGLLFLLVLWRSRNLAVSFGVVTAFLSAISMVLGFIFKNPTVKAVLITLGGVGTFFAFTIPPFSLALFGGAVGVAVITPLLILYKKSKQPAHAS